MFSVESESFSFLLDLLSLPLLASRTRCETSWRSAFLARLGYPLLGQLDG